MDLIDLHPIDTLLLMELTLRGRISMDSVTFVE